MLIRARILCRLCSTITPYTRGINNATTLPSRLSMKPTPHCTWKRGRSIYIGPGSLKSMNSAPATSLQQSKVQGVDTARSLQGDGIMSQVPFTGHVGSSYEETEEHPLATPLDISTQAATNRKMMPRPHDSDMKAARSSIGVPRASITTLHNGEHPTSQDSDASKESSESEYEISQDDTETDLKTSTGEESDGEDVVEEHIALTYQIPDDALRAAMLASERTRASYWSTKLYCGPDGERLSIHYCKSMEVAERVAQYFLKERVVGFDIEWRPHSNPKSIKQNASLIQLACEDRIALFHVSQFTGTKPEELVPPTLKTILESQAIYKVGVAIKGDFSRLQKYLDIQPQGVFELSRLHNLVKWHSTEPARVSNRLVGLAAQVSEHLQLPLYKGEQLEEDPADTASVRESDWSKPLDVQQIHYAADDAYAGFRLYHMLEWKRKQLRPTPPTRGLCDDDVRIVAKPKPRRKPETSAKPKDDTESTTLLESDLEGEAEGYATAPEELIDSHALEDPTPASRTDTSDPGYPALPLYLEGEYTATEFSSPTDQAISAPKDTRATTISSVALPDAYDEDNEFDDRELEKALRSMTLDADGKLTDIEVSSPAIAKSSTPTSTTTSSTPSFQPLTQTDTSTHTQEYNTATSWAQNYLQSTIPTPGSKAPSRIRATVPHLRAYHLWHHQALTLDEIARHLRDPPLSHSTVTSYILQAISLERLEYDAEVLKGVMMEMPTGLRKGRWKWLAEKVGALK